MPRRHEHIPIYSLSIDARLSGHFFFKKFSYSMKNKIAMEKKNKQKTRTVLGCNNDRLVPEKIYDISNTKRLQRIVHMPLGHPIILLKSN